MAVYRSRQTKNQNERNPTNAASFFFIASEKPTRRWPRPASPPASPRTPRRDSSDRNASWATRTPTTSSYRATSAVRSWCAFCSPGSRTVRCRTTSARRWTRVASGTWPRGCTTASRTRPRRRRAWRTARVRCRSSAPSSASSRSRRAARATGHPACAPCARRRDSTRS